MNIHFFSSKGLVIFLSILLTAVLSYIGASYSNVYSLAFAVLFLALFVYLLNISKIFWYFLILIPFLPPYFAFQLTPSLPVINAFRILLILLIIDQLLIKKRIPNLITTIRTDRLFVPVLIYLIGASIPGFYHFALESDKTALIGSISIIVEKVLFYYIILMNFKSFHINSDNNEFLNKIINIICGTAFVLSVLGVVEYLTNYNIFHLLETSNVEGILASDYIRQGSLRVSTSFSHALGYGLFLLLVIPIAYYRLITSRNHKKFYLFLLFLLILNMLLTSSRSTLLAFGVSVIVFFLLSNLKKKIIFFFVTSFVLLPTILFSLTTYADKVPIISTISQNTKPLADAFFGTELATNYGDNAEPFTYRNALISYAFSLEGSENMLGKGIGFIRSEPLVFYLPELNPYEPIISKSVDNYYINVKLEEGWFGFVATILFFIIVTWKLFKKRKAHPLVPFILISFCGYYVELAMVNELETLKFYFIFLAIFSTLYSTNNKNKKITD